MSNAADPTVPVALSAKSDVKPSSAEAEWLDLLAKARQGSSEATGVLINQVRDYLLLVADRELDGTLRAKVGASDLVQQTMLEAGRDFSGFRGQTATELIGWLVRILRHNLTDVARQYRGTQRREVGREIDVVAGLGIPLKSNQRTASSICRRVEMDEQLDQAITRLPQHYQRVIHLRHLQDLSWNEVAEKLSISSEAARKLWVRTLAKLREELGKEHGPKIEPARQESKRGESGR